MLTWKVILQVICVIIVAVLIFFFAVPYLMEATSQVDPILFEMKEEIRCHLFQRHGICLSLYPNPVTEGNPVEVTFRGRRWHTGQACVIDKRSIYIKEIQAIACCPLKDGRCNIDFIATSKDLSGKYFAFVDSSIINERWDGGETKGEEKELTVNPA